MYITFVRPILEYASIVWCNCTDEQKQNTENVQLAAARVITGATRGTRHHLLYEECRLEPLTTRLYRNKLVQFYKIYHGLSPRYLKDIVPNLVTNKTHYNLRNKDNITPFNAKSESLLTSFFPSALIEWNRLNITQRYIGSLADFKKSLTKKLEKNPKYYLIGQRKGQIMHTRIPLQCSALHYHLYQIKISNSPLCECQLGYETPDHYFFRCPKYTHIRDILFHLIPKSFEKNAKTFIYGNNQLPVEENIKLINTVINYIILTDRF